VKGIVDKEKKILKKNESDTDSDENMMNDLTIPEFTKNQS